MIWVLKPLALSVVVILLVFVCACRALSGFFIYVGNGLLDICICLLKYF